MLNNTISIREALEKIMTRGSQDRYFDNFD